MSNANPFDLPPWGVLDESLEADIMDDPRPKDWSLSPSDWQPWLESVSKVIERSLWPRYQPRVAIWDTPAIRLLTDRDFELLDRLHPVLGAPIDAIAPSSVVHATYFLEEDPVNGTWGKGYSRYDATLSPSIRMWIPELIGFGLRSKASTVDLQLKKILQRPRPWQLALLQGRTGFGYLKATSAFTPSLISGHCFQGVMSCANAFAVLSAQLPGNSLAVFQQFTVDIGDRRVFAGVHYPSDNLSSWFTAMRLIPLVFDAGIEKSVRAFLWDAISRRSRVFAEIRRDLGTNGNASPYAAIVREIEAAAS